MEDFKSNQKMQCFREGGQVKYESRKQHKEEMKSDIAQDKAIVKKAFKMHDKQEHKGEKTNLSKLNKGGRAKKDCGTVKKYKAGGSVENAYGAKKTDKDIKDIANSKRQKPKMLCGGKSVEKYNGEDGSWVNQGVNAIKSVGKKLYENVVGTPEQNRIGQERLDEQATEGSKIAKLLGGKAKAPSATKNESEDTFNKRRGGKVCS
jgi:hypothetical protein